MRPDLSPRAAPRRTPRPTAQASAGLRRWLLPWLLITAASALSGIAAGHLQLLGALDGRLYDIGIVSRPAQPPADVVIVGITEEFMGGLRAITPRDRLARLIEVLAAGKPSVIALDVWLDGRLDFGPRGQDARLRDALRRARGSGVTVLLNDADLARVSGAATNDRTGASGVTSHGSTLPFFRDAASGVGSVEFAPDADYIFRTLPLSSRALPSLPLLAATRHAAKTGPPLPREIEARLRRERTPIHFCGGPGAIRITPAEKLLQMPPLAALMQNKLVFIGSTYARKADFFTTPYNYLTVNEGPGGKAEVARRTYGVEMLAQSAATVLRGAPRRSADTPAARWKMALMAALMAALVAALALRGAGWGVGALLLAVVVACGMAFVSARDPGPLWGWHFWKASPSLVAAGLACGLGVGYRQLVTARLLRQVTDAFGAYVGDEILRQLGGKMPQLGGATWDIAVLFCDIEGFSALSENLRDDPERLLATLNEHFEPLVGALKDRGAYVDNYVGDLVMALFGAPVPAGSLTRDTRRAVLAALDFVRIVEARNILRAEACQPPIGVGIGLHCGPAVVGHLGSAQRVHYTAVGDTVNIASRVESATRKYHTPLLVTEEVVRACTAADDASDASGESATDAATLAALQWEFVDETTVKGRSAPVRLYRPRTQAASPTEPEAKS